MVANELTPSDRLLKEVRPALILKGHTLSSFCREHNLARQNLSAALSGQWKGKKAAALVKYVVASIDKATA